jgi:hypothetical protein
MEGSGASTIGFFCKYWQSWGNFFSSRLAAVFILPSSLFLYSSLFLVTDIKTRQKPLNIIASFCTLHHIKKSHTHTHTHRERESKCPSL